MKHKVKVCIADEYGMVTVLGGVRARIPTRLI